MEGMQHIFEVYTYVCMHVYLNLYNVYAYIHICRYIYYFKAIPNFVNGWTFL